MVLGAAIINHMLQMETSMTANQKLFLFTHSLCYIYFSQFIHHILFNVSALISRNVEQDVMKKLRKVCKNYFVCFVLTLF